MSDIEQTKMKIAAAIKDFEKNPSFGPRYADYDEDQLRETFLEAAAEEAVELAYDLMVEWGDENQEDVSQHPKDLFSEENIDKVYATQEPWRAPLFIVEVEEAHEAYDMPKQMPSVRERQFRVWTIPTDSPDLMTAEFQIREGM